MHHKLSSHEVEYKYLKTAQCLRTDDQVFLLGLDMTARYKGNATYFGNKLKCSSVAKIWQTPHHY